MRLRFELASALLATFWLEKLPEVQCVCCALQYLHLSEESKRNHSLTAGRCPRTSQLSILHLCEESKLNHSLTEGRCPLT